MLLLAAPLLLFSCKTAPKEADTQAEETTEEVSTAETEVTETAADASSENSAEASPEAAGTIRKLVYFAPDSYNVDRLTFYKLDAIVRDIRNKGVRDVKVVGHSAKLDTAKEEKTVSLKRALSVAAYLREHGVPEKGKITVVGMGAEEPDESHSEITMRGKNRRVEVIY